MRILFVYGHMIPEASATAFLKRSGYEVEAINYRELLKSPDLAARLASYEALVIETRPVRRTEENARCLDGEGLQGGDILGLHEKIKEVSDAAVVAITDKLRQHEEEALDRLGVIRVPLDIDNPNSFRKMDVWRGIQKVLAVRQVLAAGQERKLLPPPDETQEPVLFDGEHRTVSYGGQTVRLTHRQYRYLELLATTPEAMAKAAIYKILWSGSNAEPKIMDVYITIMRHKLSALFPGKDRKDFPIQTVWGVGYQWVGPRAKITSPYVPRKQAFRKAKGEVAGVENGALIEVRQAPPTAPGEPAGRVIDGAAPINVDPA